jgi:hypothetical protein
MSRLVAIVVLLALGACAMTPGSGTYCQSGAKYGTQCYAEPDVKEPPGAAREPPDPPQKGESNPSSRPPPRR